MPQVAGQFLRALSSYPAFSTYLAAISERIGIGLDWVELDWIGWIGLDAMELDWKGVYWVRLDRCAGSGFL